MSFKKYDGNIWQSINPKQLKGIPYTGTLPATLTGTKAGYLHCYKIYGNVGENLFDGALLRGYYEKINLIDDRGASGNTFRSFRIQGLPAGTYTVAWGIPVRLVRVWWNNAMHENVAQNITSYTVNTSNGDIAFSFRDERQGVYWDESTWVMLIAGSTPPESYIPYEACGERTENGYKLPLTSGSTPVDIFLGDDTLSAEEYIDSGAGKIYRMVDGVLTPVDPPVPLPQIPTTAGSTTISWAGSGLAPSEFDSIQEWVDIPTYKRVNGEWVADN